MKGGSRRLTLASSPHSTAGLSARTLLFLGLVVGASSSTSGPSPAVALGLVVGAVRSLVAPALAGEAPGALGPVLVTALLLALVLGPLPLLLVRATLVAVPALAAGVATTRAATTLATLAAAAAAATLAAAAAGCIPCRRRWHLS